jgi:hypothetical protein
MDLLTTLTAARARVAASPEDPAAWLALSDVLEVAIRGALDEDASFVLDMDRAEALSRVVTLLPTAAYLRAQVGHLGGLAGRAAGRGHTDVAWELRREQVAAARVWMRVERVADAEEALVTAAEALAEGAMARGDREAAAGAFAAMLEGLYALAHRTGRPTYALRLAGVHLHLACQLDDTTAARRSLTAARDILDRLEAAGLSHPVQAQVRAEVEERWVALEGS